MGTETRQEGFWVRFSGTTQFDERFIECKPIEQNVDQTLVRMKLSVE